jgi:UPF0755 protein
MKTIRAQNILLAITLFIICCTFAAGAYLLGWFIPAKVTNLLGPPAPELSRPYQMLYAARLYALQNDLLKATRSDPAQSLFIVESNEPVRSISERLHSEGFVRDPDSWRDYLIYSGIDRKIRSGTYLLSHDLTPIEVAAILHDDNPDHVSFAFLPGWRSEEIASLLPSSGLNADKEEFLNIISNPELSSSEFLRAFTSLEGYLYPDTYQLNRSSSAEEAIESFTRNFFQQLPPEFEAKIAQNHLNLHEAVILASIIQKEAVIAEEAPMIAGVFFNRLKAGMPLQSDPTVQYAIGYSESQSTWWRNPLAKDDLQVDSPYNTYIYHGLPPAAISNPDLSSLISVAYPAITPYYYFRSACDQSGRHIFSTTYEEHLQAACPP